MQTDTFEEYEGPFGGLNLVSCRLQVTSSCYRICAVGQQFLDELLHLS